MFCCYVCLKFCGNLCLENCVCLLLEWKAISFPLRHTFPAVFALARSSTTSCLLPLYVFPNWWVENPTTEGSIIRSSEWEEMIINRYTQIRPGFLISLQLCLYTFNTQQEFIRPCLLTFVQRTRGHGHKWQQKKFPPDLRKKHFTIRVVQWWYQLPTEAAETLFPEVKITIKVLKLTDMTEVGLALEQYI